LNNQAHVHQRLKCNATSTFANMSAQDRSEAQATIMVFLALVKDQNSVFLNRCVEACLAKIEAR
jgi:hypothetical protein